MLTTIATVRRRSGMIAIAMALIAATLILVQLDANAAAATSATVIDDFEDGDASDWGFFGGNAAGGGGGVLDDRPAEGAYYLSTGWGGEGTASGFYGGMFKNFADTAQVTIPIDPWFNVWVLSQSDTSAEQYTVEVTLREDLDGNGWTDGAEDSFRFDTTFTNAAFDDQWTLVSAPLADFVDQFTGGDGTFDGALDEIVVVVSGVQGEVGATVEVDFDQFAFSDGGPLEAGPRIIDDFESGLPSGADGNGIPIGFFTFSDGSPVSIATTESPPAPIPDADVPNNVLALTGDVIAFAGVIHGFENAAVDTWVPQDWSGSEGLSFWLYGQNTGTALFVDVIDNRNAGSTSDDGERFSVALIDDFSGWQLVELPFSSFSRKEIGNGAPNDGFTLTEVYGWALGTLDTPGEVTYYVDDVALYGVAEIPELAFNFALGKYDIPEGTTGDITVKLNRPMNEEDPAEVSINFATEPAIAIPGREYTPASGTLTFVNGGPSELSFPLETFDDAKFEGDERIVLRLANPVDAALGVLSQASAIITDDDPFDQNLLDDFEQGAYLWEPSAGAVLTVPEVAAGDPNAIPSQGPYESVLRIAPADGPSADAIKHRVIDDLSALLPTGSAKTDRQLERAIAKIDSSLNPAYWTSGYHLDARRGHRVFLRELGATDALQRVVNRGVPEAGVAAAAIDELVAADALLAGVAVNLAEAADSRWAALAKAQRWLTTGDDHAAAGLSNRAIRAYRKAWQFATLAVAGRDLPDVDLGRDFPLGEDWSDIENVTFWYYGSGSGEEITFEVKDNRAADPGPEGWELAWSDEFDDPAGTLPNPDNWGYEIGDVTPDGKNGWGNEELQYYTDDATNAATDGDGNLVMTLEAADGTLECYYGPCEYTSARLISWHRQEFAYGRIESRLLVPDGQGLWPAFWSLGTDIDRNPWPGAGEIDFMEFVGRLPNEIFGTIHGPGYSGGASFNGIYDFGEPVFSDYHTFTVEWEPQVIRWYVDGILYHTATPDDVAPNPWVFDKPFFLLLNVAIGGNFGGAVGDDVVPPRSMAVDYVRLYSAPDTAEQFEASFTDDTTGWQQVTIPIADLIRSAEQPDGAPNDGLTLTDVWGYGLSLPDGGTEIGEVLVDQFRLVPFPPPTEIVVTTLADSGAGSLRQALDDIADGGVVTFDEALAGGTIALNSGQLSVDRDVIVDGSGAPGLTVSGSNTSRVLQIDAGATVAINGVTIADGAGTGQGGGILNFGSLFLEEVVVTENTETSTGAASFDLGGGGIYNGDGARLDLANSTVRNNATIGQPGGGIYGFFNSTINVTNSTISGNVGGDVAGGLRTLGNLTVVNSTISANTSTAWHGGAMFVTDGTVSILNSTIADNTSPPGTAGGLMVATFGAPVSLTLQNSIVANNGTYGCQVEGDPGLAVFTSLGNNVTTDGTCGAGAADQVVADASIGALADNGGPTLTHALLPGSPAIDAADLVACVATDQRGVVRPQGAGCDVGSYELE